MVDQNEHREHRQLSNAEVPKVNGSTSSGLKTNEMPLAFERTGIASWFRRILGVGGTGGLRDYYAAFGYKYNPSLQDYYLKYLRNGVARRVIDAPADALWSDPPAITSSTSEFMTRWNDLVSNQLLWRRINQLDKLAALGQFGILVIGLDDNQDLAQPAKLQPSNAGSVRNVIYLQPYSQRVVKIAQWDTNNKSPRFGKPTIYRVSPQPDVLNSQFQGSVVSGVPGNVQGTSTGTRQVMQQPFDVHYTRVLHVAHSSFENDVYGTPELEGIFNWLDDLEKVIGGSAETYWMTANRGLAADVDKDMQLDANDANELSEEMNEFFNGMRRFIRTRGVKITNLGSDVADPKNNVDVIISMISASKGIPKRVLMGSEAGQLASAQDRANWADRIYEDQMQYGQPVIVLPLIRSLVGLGVLPAPDTLNVDWPEAFKLSPLERGQTSAQMARSAANLTKMMSAPVGSKEYTETTVEYTYEANPTTTTDPNATDTSTTPVPVPAPAANAAFGANLPPNVQPQERPAKIITTVVKWVEGGQSMFSMEEARNIVGFGKKMPVFDETKDSHDPAVDPSKPAVAPTSSA